MMARMGLAGKLTLIGAGELIAALLLLAPFTTPLGVLLTSAFWGGVICIHMSHGEAYIGPSVLLALTWLGAALRNPDPASTFMRVAPKEKSPAFDEVAATH
jgi:hypothetical protein